MQALVLTEMPSNKFVLIIRMFPGFHLFAHRCASNIYLQSMIPDTKSARSARINLLREI